MTSLLFNHKAEPALSPKVRVFSEENNGFGGLDTENLYSLQPWNFEILRSLDTENLYSP